MADRDDPPPRRNRGRRAKGYSEFQIKRLRTRLLRYQQMTGTQGRPKPWLQVAADVLNSDATTLAIDDNDNLPGKKKPDLGWPIMGEDLRKFVIAESKTKKKGPRIPEKNPEILNSIRDFLINEGYLKSSDLDEPTAPFHAALSLAEFCGVSEDTAGADSTFGKLDGEWQAAETLAGVARHPEHIEHAHLTMFKSADERYFIVLQNESLYLRSSKYPKFEHWPESERRACFRRCKRHSGWAVLQDSQLLVFLRAAHDERVKTQFLSSASGPDVVDAVAFAELPAVKLPDGEETSQEPSCAMHVRHFRRIRP